MVYIGKFRVNKLVFYWLLGRLVVLCEKITDLYLEEIDMKIFTLELNNDLKGIDKRKKYIESLISGLSQPDLIVLPELAMCSYIGNDSVWDYSDNDSADTSEWAIEMARKYDTFIATGYLEKQGDEIYNSYLIADKNKVYGNVRKSEGESHIFKRGYFDNIINTPFGNVAVGICYDSRRKHIYNNIKDETISLILFPHGCPADPKKPDYEKATNDYFCNAYAEAFDVPVVYSNSVGKLDLMFGNTGKMMMSAGFKLNGYSKIYCNSGTAIESDLKESIAIDVDLKPKTRKKDIHFYGEDINKGNFLFRQFVIKPDIKRGLKYYEDNKPRK